MKIVYRNKKAYFDYEVLEEYKAGIALTGGEVKSVRQGHLHFKGAYVSIQGGEAFLKNSHITKYPYDQSKDYDPIRTRKLLLKAKEIEKLSARLDTQGVTVIPLAMAFEGPFAKVLIAVARGKKKSDKRHSIKERETKRTTERAMRTFR